MPIFKYRVRDKSGKSIDGTIDAPNLQMAGDQLYSLGYFPISLKGEIGNRFPQPFRSMETISKGEVRGTHRL